MQFSSVITLSHLQWLRDTVPILLDHNNLWEISRLLGLWRGRGVEKLILGSRYFFEGNGGGISCRQQSIEGVKNS